MAKYILTDTNNETPVMHHINNDIIIQAFGDFKGGKLQFEYSQDDLPYITLDDFSITKNDVLSVSPAFSCNYKIKLENATSGASVNVSILPRQS